MFCPLAGKSGFSRLPEVKFINQIKYMRNIATVFFRLLANVKTVNAKTVNANMLYEARELFAIKTAAQQ